MRHETNFLLLINGIISHYRKPNVLIFCMFCWSFGVSLINPMLKKKINPNFNPLFVPSFCVPPLLSTPDPTDISLNSEEVYSHPLLWQSCEKLTSAVQDKIVKLWKTHKTKLCSLAEWSKHIPQQITNTSHSISLSFIFSKYSLSNSAGGRKPVVSEQYM